MPVPETPKQQMDKALDEAWEAAEKCKVLLEQNNHSSAAVWAQASAAWATIAAAVATRLNA
jgi:hypothetical protein